MKKNLSKEIIVLILVISLFPKINATMVGVEQFNKAKYFNQLHAFDYYFLNTRNIDDYEINTLLNLIKPILMSINTTKRTDIRIKLTPKLCNCNFNTFIAIGINHETEQLEIITPELSFQGINWIETFNTTFYTNILFGALKQLEKMDYYTNAKEIAIALINPRETEEKWTITRIIGNQTVNETGLVKPKTVKLIRYKITRSQKVILKYLENQIIQEIHIVKRKKKKIKYVPVVNVSINNSNIMFTDIIDIKGTILNDDSLSNYTIKITSNSSNFIIPNITKKIELIPFEKTEFNIPIIPKLKKTGHATLTTPFQFVINYDMKNILQYSFLETLNINVEIRSKGYIYKRSFSIPVFNLYLSSSNLFEEIIAGMIAIITTTYLILILYKKQKKSKKNGTKRKSK